MAPREGGLSFPADDVVCGRHVLGDVLQQTEPGWVSGARPLGPVHLSRGRWWHTAAWWHSSGPCSSAPSLPLEESRTAYLVGLVIASCCPSPPTPRGHKKTGCPARAGGGAGEHHSRLPSGSPRGPAGGGWARWPRCDSGGLGTCSAGGGCASASAVSCAREGWVSARLTRQGPLPWSPPICPWTSRTLSPAGPGWQESLGAVEP